MQPYPPYLAFAASTCFLTLETNHSTIHPLFCFLQKWSISTWFGIHNSFHTSQILTFSLHKTRVLILRVRVLIMYHCEWTVAHLATTGACTCTPQSLASTCTSCSHTFCAFAVHNVIVIVWLWIINHQLRVQTGTDRIPVPSTVDWWGNIRRRVVCQIPNLTLMVGTFHVLGERTLCWRKLLLILAYFWNNL